MLKKSLLLLCAVLVITSSCKELCENGNYPFCEDNGAETLGKFTEKSLGPAGDSPTSFSIGNIGYQGLSAASPPIYPTNNFYSYNPATDTWDSIRSLPGRPRNAAFGFGTPSKGFVGAGYAVEFSDGSGDNVYLKDFYEYDPQTNSWTQKADMPGGEGFYIGFAIGNKGYAMKDSSFWQYDPLTDSWSAKAKCPVDRGTTFSVGPYGYILNGKFLYQYNPVTNSWAQKAEYPGEEALTSFATIKRGYIVSKTYTWEYRPLTNAWYRKAKTPRIDEVSGLLLEAQPGFGIGNKGYFGIVYRGIPKYFYEFDPEK